jgi:hypothetical protein
VKQGNFNELERHLYEGNVHKHPRSHMTVRRTVLCKTNANTFTSL